MRSFKQRVCRQSHPELERSLGVVPLSDCWVEQWWDVAIPGRDETEFCKVIAITVGIEANNHCCRFA